MSKKNLIWKKKCIQCKEYFLTKTTSRYYCDSCIEKKNRSRSEKNNISHEICIV